MVFYTILVFFIFALFVSVKICFRSEEVKEVQDDKQKGEITEASGSSMDTTPSLDISDQETLGRYKDYLIIFLLSSCIAILC